MSKPALAVSIGDPNGIGPEIALRAHAEISKLCEPHYCADTALLRDAGRRLGIPIPENFTMCPPGPTPPFIHPGCVSAEAGRYSFASFTSALDLTDAGTTRAVVTLPINKEAWQAAGIGYKGHTDALRDRYGRDAIMMLGCDRLYVALFTEHIPLKRVSESIQVAPLVRFLLDFQHSVGAERIGVLGLNPHAGDHGVLGDEEIMISEAIEQANRQIGYPLFQGPLVPDVAFTPHARERFRYLVAMYHDQGLAPLKALYFDESINVSLNLPIIRTSVDHGTAFDIAYRQGRVLSLRSYLAAVKAALELIGTVEESVSS